MPVLLWASRAEVEPEALQQLVKLAESPLPVRRPTRCPVAPGLSRQCCPQLTPVCAGRPCCSHAGRAPGQGRHGAAHAHSLSPAIVLQATRHAGTVGCMGCPRLGCMQAGRQSPDSRWRADRHGLCVGQLRLSQRCGGQSRALSHMCCATPGKPQPQPLRGRSTSAVAWAPFLCRACTRTTCLRSRCGRSKVASRPTSPQVRGPRSGAAPQLHTLTLRAAVHALAAALRGRCSCAEDGSATPSCNALNPCLHRAQRTAGAWLASGRVPQHQSHAPCQQHLRSLCPCAGQGSTAISTRCPVRGRLWTRSATRSRPAGTWRRPRTRGSRRSSWAPWAAETTSWVLPQPHLRLVPARAHA